MSMSVPGHMAKARREIEENHEEDRCCDRDIDARIPRSSHNPMLDDVTANKPKVVILNKKGHG